jgi:uncharacterized coiled-coil DUF342 family protein
MKLDQTYSVETDAYNVTLVKREPYISEKDGSSKIRENRAYYATLQQALKAYVQDAVKPAQNVSDCLERMEELEKRIDGLATTITDYRK